MNKKRKYILISMITVSLIITIFNITPLPFILGIEPVIIVYHYENSNGDEIIEVPAKGSTIDYKEPGLKRKFKKNYLKFWNWYRYMKHPRWDIEFYK